MQNMQVCERQFTQKIAWKLRQLRHLFNPFRLSCLCFTFLPTLKNCHKRKIIQTKKDFVTTHLRCCGTKLVEQKFEVGEVNPKEANQKKIFKDFIALHAVLGINKQLFLYIISKGTLH